MDRIPSPPMIPAGSVDAMNAKELRHRGRISLRISERKALLAIIDLVAVTAALLLILSWRLHLPFGWETVGLHWTWFLLLGSLWCVLAPLLDAYDLPSASRLYRGTLTGGGVALVVAIIYLAIPYVTPPLNASRLTAGAFIALTTGTVAAGRGLYALLFGQGLFRRRILIVGAGRAGRTLAAVIATHATALYEAVGFVDDDPAKQLQWIGDLPVLGSRKDLVRVVQKWEVDEIAIAISHHDTMDGDLIRAVIDSRELGLRVTAMPVLYEQLTGKVLIEHAGRGLHVVIPLERDPGRAYLAGRRAVDLGVGLVAAMITLLLLPLVDLALRLTSPGPVFYNQVRVGRGGRLFTLLKFRTMIPNAETDGPRWAEESDARVTGVGRILRRLHLDEFPQSVNLLRGELSIIGPRPERPEFVAKLVEEIPFYRARHAITPGITGWAQVNYPYGASVQDALAKLQYDLYYIKHQSVWLDLLILARTARLISMLRGR